MSDHLNLSEWSIMHDLAVIYLALTHGTDEQLNDSEKQAMAQKLEEWFKVEDRDRIHQVLTEAMRAYSREDSDRRIRTSVDSVGEEMNRGLRIAVLDDLSDIASADGRVLHGEKSLLQHLADAWGIEKEVD